MELPLLKCVMCKSPTTFALVEDNGAHTPVCSEKCERKYERFLARMEDECW